MVHRSIRSAVGLSGLNEPDHIMIAVREGCVQSLLAAIENGTMDLKDILTETPLMVACEKNQLEMVKILLSAGAKMTVKDDKGCTGFMKAAANGYLEMVKYLHESALAGIGVSQRAQKRRFDDNGASVVVLGLLNSRDGRGNSALLLAAMNGHLNVVDYLEKNGAATDIKNNIGWNLAICSAYSGNIDLVKYTADLGKDVLNAYGEYHGDTPLQKAAGCNHVGVCEYLISQGAKCNSTDQYGQTPLMWAAALGAKDTLSYLIEQGSSLTRVTKSGLSLYHVAALCGNNRILEILINNSKEDALAKIDDYTDDGNTALHFAVQGQSKECVSLLVKAGADINKLSFQQQTALMSAIITRQEATVKVLLSLGADISIQNNLSYDARKIANDMNLSNIVELLDEIKLGHKVQVDPIAEDSSGYSSFGESSDSDFEDAPKFRNTSANVESLTSLLK